MRPAVVGDGVRDGGRRGGGLRVALGLVLALSLSGLVACSSDDGATAKDAGKKSTTTTTVAASTSTTVAGTPLTSTGAPTTEPGGSGAGTTVQPAGVTAPPVAMDQTAAFGDGVTARIAKLQAVQATAMLPGETSGPAVAVTVEVTNGTKEPVDVGRVTVDLTTSDGVSTSQVTTPPASPLAGELGAGRSRTGLYLFRVPAEARSNVGIRVKYSSDTPIVIFAGSVPNG
jgi:hypothetical protein